MEALGAVEKPPCTAPGRSAEDWFAGREALAKAARLSGPRLFAAPIPGRVAAECLEPLQHAGEGDGERWVTPRAGIQVGLE